MQKMQKDKKKSFAIVETKTEEIENESDLSDSESDDDTHKEGSCIQMSKN